MANNTGNPIGSDSYPDFQDNVQNLDHLVAGEALSWADRFGKQRKSWAGIESEFSASQEDRESEFSISQGDRNNEFNQFMASTAYELPPIKYTEGTQLEVERPTQIIEYLGNLYSVKLPATFPIVISGDWNSAQENLTLRSDQALRQQLASNGADMLAFNRTKLADSVGSLGRYLSAQKVNVWEEQFVSLVTSKPALDPDTWDWTEPQLAMIRYCKESPNRAIEYTGGIFGTSETLDFGSLCVDGGITGSNRGSTIKALREGMLLTKFNSNCLISGIRLHGDNKAIWNALTIGNRPVIIKVESGYAKEFGFVFGSTQNGNFYSLVSYFCKYSFGLFNGVRNCNFFGCGSATSSGPTGVRDPDSVEIVTDFDLSNPHGFGLPQIITANGNDRIAFFGGIFEYPRTIMKMRNTENSLLDVGNIFFYSVEMAGGGIILDTSELPSGSSPRLIFNNCEFTWLDQVTPFSKGVRGILEFQGLTTMSGGGTLPNRGITQVNNFDSRGFRIQDGTTYITDLGVPTTITPNGISRLGTSGSIVNPVSFMTGSAEVFFSTKEGAAFTSGGSYRTAKGSTGESLACPATFGLNKVGEYLSSGPLPFPNGITATSENLGNGASDASLFGFRVRNSGGNNYAYHGLAGGAYVIGIRGTGASYQERLRINASGNISPGVDNAQALGAPSLRFSVVYAGTSTINTSDERLKCDIREVSEKERAVALKLKKSIRAFRLNDAVEAKGDGARIHFGFIAQEVERIFASEGLNAFEYGMLCYDKWDAEYEDVCEEFPILVDGKPLLDDDGAPCMEGRPTGEKRMIKEAGDRYGVREKEIHSLILSCP